MFIATITQISIHLDLEHDLQPRMSIYNGESFEKAKRCVIGYSGFEVTSSEPIESTGTNACRVKTPARTIVAKLMMMKIATGSMLAPARSKMIPITGGITKLPTAAPPTMIVVELARKTTPSVEGRARTPGK